MANGETSPAGRATLEDVARVAGVSLATVDRVVNRREGVREKTIARVEAAVARLGYRADPLAARLARNQSFRFAFILPTGSNSFMMNLTEQVERTADWLVGQRAFIDILHVDVFDPDALAGALEQLPSAYQGIATIALDHPRVRAAIDDLAARNVAVVTLVSDAPSSRRMHYVGIDNPAAGRTVATLMGRFLSARRQRTHPGAGVRPPETESRSARHLQRRCRQSGHCRGIGGRRPVPRYRLDRP